MSFTDKLSSIAYRIRMAGADLSEIIDSLKALQVLDRSLDGLEQAFESRFEERFAATPIDPEIKNQLDVYKKAKEGLEHAKAAKAALENLMKIHPEEKAAQRAMEEAERLVGKYVRHMEAGKKIISTAAKKTMPPGLKKMTNDVAKLIKDRLADPDGLVITPWQGEVKIYQDRYNSTMGVGYSVSFQVKDVDAEYEEYDSNGRAVWKTRKKTVVWSLFENFIMAVTPGQSPPLTAKAETSGDRKEATSAKEVADFFLKSLVGWSGLKGEDESRKKRDAVAGAIGSILGNLCRKWGSKGADSPEWDANFLQVTCSFRRYAKESEDRYSQRDLIEKEMVQVRKELEASLKPYAASNPQISIGGGEKGWVGISISIK